MANIYKVTNLVLKRGSENGGDAVDASWGISGATGAFGGGFDETWTFNASKDMTKTVVRQMGAGSATGDIVQTVNGDGYHSTAYCFYDRSKYHPLAKGRYLKSATCKVKHYSESTTATLAFEKPRQPVIGEPVYDAQTQDVTFTVDTDEGADQKERYDTVYRLVRQNSMAVGPDYYEPETVLDWTSTTETSEDVTYDDLSLLPGIQAGEWVKITCEAYARGLRGDSAVTKREYVYAYPAQASILEVYALDKSATGVVTVGLKTNATATAPVDTVKLQRLKNTTATTAAAAGLASGWTDVSGATDDGNCYGLTDAVSDAKPTAQLHTWYRLVTTHGPFTRYSVAVEAECLFTAKSPQSGDVVKYASIEPGSDGTSIALRVAWNNDSCDTTQVAWGTHEDAWESTEQPSIYDIAWEDSTPWTDTSVTPNVTYNHSATITIRGLEESTNYYVRARRALLSGDTPAYGNWCAAPKYPASTAMAPADVVLTVPAVVERGSGIDCSWTFDGGEQTAWEVRYLDGSNVKVLAAGEGPSGSTVIPAEKIAGMDSVSLSVAVTAGGDWSASAYAPVTIDEAPELALSVPSTLTAQPLSITLGCSTPRAAVIVYVTSRGVSTATPDGSAVQADGDVVWSESLAPEWVAQYAQTSDTSVVSGKAYFTLSNGVYSRVASPSTSNISNYYELDGYSATVTAPIVKLYEGASYDVAAVATDTYTLLSSDAAVDGFKVAWSHRAVAPKSTSAITTSDLTATITPVAPTSGYGAGDAVAQSDVVDVYRSTPDGNYLIATDVPFGVTVRDRYAPFSDRAELAYVLCTRTADGDIAWGEYAYTLAHATLRVDFGEQSVELPYDITMTDGWQKGFELREHLDGTRAGYWNEGATRKATLSTDVVKVESASQRRLLAELAQHAGPCFVRTPDGCAYPADVQVDSYGVAFDSGAVPVSISATEVAMTDAFRIAPGDWYATTTTTTGA